MRVLFSRHKTKMVTPTEALPGREQPTFTVPERHAVQAQNCGCGLYAWLDVGGALGYLEIDTPKGWVLASVIGWGRVLFDEEFWRAEQAQVVAFTDPRDVKQDVAEGDRGVA